MYFKDFLKLAIINISRKKGRFFLSALSISIGIATVVFITSAGNSGMSMINDELSKMGLNLCVIKTENGYIYNNDIIALQSGLSDDYFVSSVIKIPAELYMPLSNNECIVYGGDEEILDVFDYKVLCGRNIRTDDLINEKKIVIIDDKLSNELFGEIDSVGKELCIKINEKEEKFKIVGVTDSSAVKNNFDKEIPVFIFAPHTTVKKLLSIPCVSEIYTLSRNGNEGNYEIKNTVDLINGDRSSEKKLIYKDMNSYKRNIDYIVDTITLILALIGAISLISGGIGVVNTMIMSVSERRGEIGIKKALGQTDYSIVIELIYEAIITMIFALFIGLIAGMTLSYVSLKAFDMAFVPDYNSVVLISLISFFMGIIFGFIPSLKTFSMNPVEILK